MADKTLDTKGLNCPLPILKTKKAMQDVPNGGTLEVLATDPGSVADFEAFCRTTGNTLVVSLGSLDRVMNPHVQVTDRDFEIISVDVRNVGEARLGGIPGSVNIPLPELLGRLGELDPDRPTAVACASGYRSSIAASTLAARGFTDVSDLLGGYDAWAKAGQPVETTTRT